MPGTENWKEVPPAGEVASLKPADIWICWEEVFITHVGVVGKLTQLEH